MSSTNPEAVARLLRLRADAEPLRIEVAGSSMGRTIVSGSAVWVVGARRPRWGEIWAFCDPESRVQVHRCVGHRSGRNRFWGDANPAADALVDDAFVIGRVIAVEPVGGEYTRVHSCRQLIDAARVGARRLPRRLWHRGRDAARNVFGSR
jgi:hypothetical protein